MNNSSTIVEHNLFDRCDGETRDHLQQVVRQHLPHNTFLDCAGMFTLRHGNRCLVDGNFFLGHHKRGSGGIRVIGDEHTVINNYIDGVMKAASGSPRAYRTRKPARILSVPRLPDRVQHDRRFRRTVPAFGCRHRHFRPHAAPRKHHDRQQPAFARRRWNIAQRQRGCWI